MARMKSFADPDAFIADAGPWQHPLVEMLRSTILAAAPFDEMIKWGNLVFVSNGPCILIHVEAHRVMLGFWRGKRLKAMEPLIKPSGKYELGNITLREGEGLASDRVARLAVAAASLNAQFGDPTRLL